MKTVALIPIKLNSQRVPHKNILPLMGYPLCWHICNTMLQITEIDEIYVYCSKEEVIQYLPDGVKFLKRDKSLDGDNIKGFDIYEKFINTIDADVYVLAHTTSPFIEAETMRKALQKVQNGENDSAFSAERIQTFAWYKNNPINYDLCDVPRTQDMEPIWVETSAFYIFKKEIFTEFHRRIGFSPYIAEVSKEEAMDIDEMEDYTFACKIAEMKG